METGSSLRLKRSRTFKFLQIFGLLLSYTSLSVSSAPATPASEANQEAELPQVKHSVHTASVDGTPVSSQSYFMHYQHLLRGHPTAQGKPALERRLAKRVLVPLVEELLLRKAAQQDGVDLTHVEIDDPIIPLKRAHTRPERLTQYLQRVGETEETLRLKTWNTVVTRLLMEKRALLTVTEEEIVAEYQRLLPRWSQPERVRGRQILFSLPKSPTPEQVNQAFQQAQAVHALLIAKEVSFKVAVQQYSDGPLRPKGGDFGLQAKGKLVLPVEEALWALKDGELSIPVRSIYGWHIILRVASQGAQSKTLDETRSKIIEMLKDVKFSRERRAFMQSLWDAARIDSAVPLR